MFKNVQFDVNGRPLLKTLSSDGRHFTMLGGPSFVAADGTEYVAPDDGTATSDGASTPPILWTLFGREFLAPFGIYWPAVYWHDGGYQNWLMIRQADGTLKRANLTKEQSDKLCLEIMEALKVPWLIRDDIYEGVVLGGAMAFSDDRKNALAINLATLAQPQTA